MVLQVLQDAHGNVRVYLQLLYRSGKPYYYYEMQCEKPANHFISTRVPQIRTYGGGSHNFQLLSSYDRCYYYYIQYLHRPMTLLKGHSLIVQTI